MDPYTQLPVFPPTMPGEAPILPPQILQEQPIAIPYDPLAPQHGKTYCIRPKITTTKLLDVFQNLKTPGAKIIMYDPNFSNNQRFTVVNTPQGFQLIVQHTKMPLAIEVLKEKANIVQLNQPNLLTSYWQFVPSGLNDGYYYIMMRYSEVPMCMEVRDGGKESWTEIIIAPQMPSPSQLFKFIP